MKALVIDSDPRSTRYYERILKGDYIIDFADNAESAENLAYDSQYDIFITELVLPDMDGEDLCSILKSRFKKTPVLVVSSKNSLDDKDLAFEKGADDFLSKPISGRELKARIKALLRRYSNNFEEDLFDKVIDLGFIKVDRHRRQAVCNGKQVYLRRKEYHLLEYLAVNRDRVLTRGEILESVWDANVSMFTNTVDVHIKRLRDKIEKPFGISFIQTIHGIGYLVEKAVKGKKT